MISSVVIAIFIDLTYFWQKLCDKIGDSWNYFFLIQAIDKSFAINIY